jgi:glycosyltransferase involved in cell wall biosynthesis
LVYAAKPAKRKGAKIVLDMHEITPEFFMSKYNINENHLIIKILKWFERKSLEYADHVITINDQLKNIFISRAKIKNEVTVIMNTVNDETLPRLPKEKQQKFTAVYHGTISSLYNLDFTIKALGKIKSELDNFEFHIYGNGAELEKLRSLVTILCLEKAVFIHGHVVHTEIPKILSKADLGILPIKKDIMTDLSFSNKLAEYIHCGIPVLSSDLKTIQKYFPEGTVHYYKSNDENDFCSTLLQIMTSYNKASVNAEQAYEINKKISWDIMKKRLQELTLSVS